MSNIFLMDTEVDLDGDGYATCSGDCDDNDPERSPGACPFRETRSQQTVAASVVRSAARLIAHMSRWTLTSSFLLAVLRLV